MSVTFIKLVAIRTPEARYLCPFAGGAGAFRLPTEIAISDWLVDSFWILMVNQLGTILEKAWKSECGRISRFLVPAVLLAVTPFLVSYLNMLVDFRVWKNWHLRNG
jgi:hypothetical protein